MRKLYFLVPGTYGKFACGGLWAELKTVKLAQQICSADVVTYRQRETDQLFIDDLLTAENLDAAIFVISWGFDIAQLAAKLKQYHVIYHAHSAGYKFRLPGSIPIITVSRNTMGYWGQKSPNSLIYYLPNQISNEFKNLHLDRDIDVLVQARKSSEYLIQELIYLGYLIRRRFTCMTPPNIGRNSLLVKALDYNQWKPLLVAVRCFPVSTVDCQII
jgi:hypothetical protein